MMRKKKHITLGLCAILIICLLTGCGGQPKAIKPVEAETTTEKASMAMAEPDAKLQEAPDVKLQEEGAGFLEDVSRIEAAAGAVVKLESYDAGGNRISNGSGFCAVEEGKLITAAHLITNMHHMVATKDNGETFEVGRVIAWDQDYDFVICEIPDQVKMDVLQTSCDGAARGEKIAVISSMLGMVNMVTMGNCCGRWSEANKEWIMFSAPVSSGSSGAPIFNDRGEVIGIVSGTYDGGQNVNIATPISAIMSWFEDSEEE